MSFPIPTKHSSYDENSREIRKIGHQIFEGGYDRIVFTNGCFDILHVGHLGVLSHARALAGTRGAVVVGINDDASVERLKGSGHPIIDENSRATLLINLRLVDHVVSFSEDTPAELISCLKPHVIVKGGDYKAEDVVGKELAYVSIAPFSEGWSTSKIVEKIRGT
jgi:D-beta-D-heptose 7-phosphate kinase/D-beta-D-heptose 1-phosphate adenosyltransferase